MKSPLKWLGGKFYLAAALIKLFPEHITYVEPFGGGAHVLCQKPQSKVEIYNDIDSNAVNFLIQSVQNTAELITKCNEIPYAREVYHDLKNKELPENKIERAAAWFYLIRSAFGGGGGRKNLSGWRASKQRNVAKQYYNSINSFEDLRARFQNVQIENLDYREIIKRYDSEETLFFVDPPYFDREYLYNGNFTLQDHKDLANLLNNIKGKAIVSYYDNELLNELYPNWTRNEIDTVVHTYHVTSGSQRRKEKEIVLTNYTPTSLTVAV